MTRALRVVSVERGLDPRELTLVAFGGAGGTHACALAEELGMTRVLVPLAAGVLSALGLALGDARRDLTRPLFGRLDTVDLDGAFADLTAEAADGVEAGTRLERQVDCRYAGQAHELTIPVGAESGEAEGKAGLAAAVRAAFEAEHLRRYGHQAPGREVEVVAVRLVATVPGLRPRLAAPPADRAVPHPRRPAYLAGRWVDVEVVPRAALGPGDGVPGPAVVEFAEATCLVRPGWTAVVDDVGTLVMTRVTRATTGQPAPDPERDGPPPG
jgi:N-methylhydantoinase A